MNNEIKKYYDDLATTYDENRFGNSYGEFIDKQEKAFLSQCFSKVENLKVLDLGCGTGRLIEFANFGVDVSSNMLEVAKNKFPNKEFRVGSVSSIPFENDFFDFIFSFHVIMHLDKASTLEFLNESKLKLRKKGRLVFDFPSKKRRLLTNYKTNGWHGSNHFSLSEIEKMLGDDWQLKNVRGVLFLPVHRIPYNFRKLFLKLDNLLCASFLKEFASYLIIEIERK